MVVWRQRTWIHESLSTTVSHIQHRFLLLIPSSAYWQSGLCELKYCDFHYDITLNHHFKLIEDREFNHLTNILKMFLIPKYLKFHTTPRFYFWGKCGLCINNFWIFGMLARWFGQYAMKHGARCLSCGVNGLEFTIFRPNWLGSWSWMKARQSHTAEPVHLLVGQLLAI